MGGMENKEPQKHADHALTFIELSLIVVCSDRVREVLQQFDLAHADVVQLITLGILIPTTVGLAIEAGTRELGSKRK